MKFIGDKEDINEIPRFHHVALWEQSTLSFNHYIYYTILYYSIS